MTNNNFIRKLLKLKDLKVVNFAFNRGVELEIAVKPYKNGCRYQQCGRRGRIVRTRPTSWQMEGYIGGQLDGMVAVLSPRDCVSDPWARPGSHCLGRAACTVQLSV